MRGSVRELLHERAHGTHRPGTTGRPARAAAKPSRRGSAPPLLGSASGHVGLVRAGRQGLGACQCPCQRDMKRSGYSGDCFGCVTRPERCAPVGDGTQILDLIPREESEAKRGVGVESATLHVRDTGRIRHQTECSWNQTQTDRGATVSEAVNSGDEAEQCRSRSGVAGRSVGGANAAFPVIYPDNGGMTQPNQSLENLERIPCARG